MRVPRITAFVVHLLLLSSFALWHSVIQAQTPRLHWSQDGESFWFQQDSDSDNPSFLRVDIAGRSSKPLFDLTATRRLLADALKTEEQKLEFQGVTTDDEEEIILRVNGKNFVLHQDGANLAIEATAEDYRWPEATAFFLPPRPGQAGPSTDINILNELDEPIELVWFQNRWSPQSYGTVDAGGERKQHTYAGHIWGIRKNGNLLACFEAQPDAHIRITQQALDDVVSNRPPRVRGRRDRPTWLSNSRGSQAPDDLWKTEIRGKDELWLVPTESNDAKERLLASNEDQDWSFRQTGEGTRWFSEQRTAESQGEIHWSPDSRFIVAWQFKVVDEPRVHYVESTPRDQLQPKLHSYQYAKPGDELPIKRLRLYSRAPQREITVSHELFANPFSLRFLGWSESGDRFYLHYNQRGHQTVRVLEVLCETGAVRPIIEETNSTFVHYSDPGKSVFDEISDSEFLWASERSGWNHLYLFNRQEGQLVRAVTEGNWNVKRVLRIDREARQIWFLAVGIYPDQDPYHEHLARVDLDGSNLTFLTDGDGTHEIEFIRENKFFMDRYSRVDQAPTTELRDSQTGELIVQLSQENTLDRFGDRRLTERFVAKGRDGETDIWGIIHWPQDFDPNKKYPVIEQIYAGPHDHHVPKAFRARYGTQHALADAGFIVVQIDGMGTAWRSKAFHDVCFKNLRDAGFPDRIAWLRAAAQAHPQLDLTRVGIFGGSAGGQNAMAAVLWHHDFYKVAVADCGCHDNRMDKIWWNEQWMGWPVDKSYEENSNMENAHLLQGHLMLTVGEKDENVDPATTLQVVKKLIEADKDFEFVLIPGAGHGAGESPWARRKRLNFFIKHLQQSEAP